MRRLEIKISGVGGQGVASLGNTLGRAAAFEGKYVAHSYSYGIGTRGGSSSSEVILSDTKIDYPFIIEADIAVIASEKVLGNALKVLKEGGLLIIDSDLVKTRSFSKKFKVAMIPAAKIADSLGNRILTGIVALGGLVRCAEPVSKDSAIEAIKIYVPAAFREENITAFMKGMDAVDFLYGDVA